MLLLTACIFTAASVNLAGQSGLIIPSAASPSTSFRIGEKLSYTVSFGKFNNAAYFETQVVSKGKLSGQEAVELRAKLKTLEIVRAAFFTIDEQRTVFVSPDSGLPLYISSNSNNSILPIEKISNYLTVPTLSYDLVSLIYRIRMSGSTGSLPLLENDQASTVTFLPTAAERVRTDSGEFDTMVSTVQGVSLGGVLLQDLKINFTSDDARIPVQIRFKTPRGHFKALLTGIAIPDPPVAVVAITPTPTPVQAGTPGPRPTPVPEVYIDNRPLLPELGFQLGEILDYRITMAGKHAGRITFNVQHRQQFQGRDSLLLTATITAVEPGSGLTLGDSVRAQVDPETLTPDWATFQFGTSMPGLRQTTTFDKRTGMVNFGGPQGIDSPIGTHNLLSLFYAMRSFNLIPSKNLSNPVNDTRVAVFWENKPYIFTLRPGDTSEITLSDEKFPAQLIIINTSVPQLDALGLKIWLSPDYRIPVRFSAGVYQADLLPVGPVFSK